MRAAGAVTVVGHRSEPSHYQLRDFLTRIDQEFFWLEATNCGLDLTREKLPAVIEPASGNRSKVYINASIQSLSEAWSIPTVPSRGHYDLAIIGGGPAGLAAAVYAASDGLKTVILDSNVVGGQAGHTSAIENLFGFPAGIPGAELANLATQQAQSFGAEIVQLADVRTVLPGTGGPAFDINVAGQLVAADQVIVATGMEWRRLDVPGIDELVGRGVHYGTGHSEAAQCREESVVVVGGGNSAGQAAMNLAESGAKVKLIVRGSSIFDSMSEYLATRIAEMDRPSGTAGGIQIINESNIVEVREEDDELVVVYERGRSRWPLSVDSVFVCIGGAPNTDFLSGVGPLCKDRFLLTGPDIKEVPEAFWKAGRPPGALETSVPGLFAAGDVRWGSPRRVGGAIGDGAGAVALAQRITA